MNGKVATMKKFLPYVKVGTQVPRVLLLCHHRVGAAVSMYYLLTGY